MNKQLLHVFLFALLFISAYSQEQEYQDKKCPRHSKKMKACPFIYSPVCGTLLYGDALELQTFDNSCVACQNSNIMSFTEGPCESISELPSEETDELIIDPYPVEPIQNFGFCQGKYEMCTEEYRMPPYCGIQLSVKGEPLNFIEGGNECQVCSIDGVFAFFEGYCDEQSVKDFVYQKLGDKLYGREENIDESFP